MTGYVIAPAIYANVFADFRAFVLAATGLPSVNVLRGLANRAAMQLPSAPFIILTPILLKRLRTNVDTWDQSLTAPTETSQEMGTQLTIQLDVYGETSGDIAAMLTTLLRDEVACNALTTCQPLYAEDPKMAPLIDAELQYEERWTLGAVLQYNPVTTVPMQFADTLTIDLINVDEAYPP